MNRIPRDGLTVQTFNISPTERIRNRNSETYRTLPSKSYTPIQKTEQNLVITNPLTSPNFLQPRTSLVSGRTFETQTRNYKHGFTNISSVGHPKPTLNKTRINHQYTPLFVHQGRTEETKTTSSFLIPTTIFPMSSSSPKTEKYLNNLTSFYQGISTSESTLPTTTYKNEVYTVPPERRKRKKTSNETHQEFGKEKNLESPLHEKVLSRRALNHSTGDYEFQLLAKYDVMPRPFVPRQQKSLKTAVTQVQSKKFGQHQVYPTTSVTLRNLNNTLLIPSTISRRTTATKRRNNSSKPYASIGIYNALTSTFIPYTTTLSSITTTEDISHRREESRGRARYKDINTELKAETGSQDFSTSRYPAKNVDKVAEGKKLEHYEIVKKPEKHYEHEDDYKHQNPNYYAKHHQSYDKNYQGNDENHQGNNKHNHLNGKHHQSPGKYNQVHYYKYEDDDEHQKDIHNILRTHGDESKHRKGNADNYHEDSHDHHTNYENDFQNYNEADQNPGLNSRYKNNIKQNEQNQDVKHKDSNKEERDHNHNRHNSDEVDSEDQNQEVKLKDSNQEERDHSHDRYNSGKVESKDQNQDHESEDKNKVHEENEGEHTHKHEHKHNQELEGKDHEHEVGGSSEHEEEHNDEEDAQGDKV